LPNSLPARTAVDLCKNRCVGLVCRRHLAITHWLQSGYEQEPRGPLLAQIFRLDKKLHLAVEHFTFQINLLRKQSSPYYRYIFNHTKLRNCLIFANNRAETESVIAGLRQILSEELPDIYHVHHGSISAQLREASENAMCNSTAAVTCNTHS